MKDKVNNLLKAGIPVISIAYQHKSSGTMKLLGLDNFCLNIEQLNPEEIFALIGDILDHSTEIRDKIRDKVYSIKKTIEKKLNSSIKLSC